MENKRTLALIGLVVVLVIGGIWAISQGQQGAEPEPPAFRKLTDEELESRRGQRVEVPVEDTKPREQDPETGEYLETEYSGETTEIFVPYPGFIE